jgi:acetyltransferase-like isoleucine patch superfamily enzyme
MPGPPYVHAVVDPDASVAADCTIGPFSVIGRGARLGPGCRIGAHVVVHADAQIGARVRIDDHAVVGKSPMQAASSATTTLDPLPPVRIGDECMIGTQAIVYRGATLAARVLVADLAAVRERVEIGERTIIGWGAYVESDCRVGAGVKMEAGAYLTAYSVVEDHCFIAPGVVTSNDNFVGRTQERFQQFKGVTIRRGGRVGAGATILPGKVIAEEALVAAGSVVTRDAPPGQVVLGAPARAVRPVAPEQFWDAGDHARKPRTPRAP